MVHVNACDQGIPSQQGRVPQQEPKKKTHMSVCANHPHTHETLSRDSFRLLAQPSLFKGMTTRDRLPKACAYHFPSLTVVVQPKDAYQLLEMIVDHGVVHACIDIIECLGDYRVARNDVQRDACRSKEGWRVHAQPAKVANNEATEFVWRRQGEARDGVLRMCLEGNAVL